MRNDHLLVAAPVEHDVVLCVDAAGQLTGQARLADAGLTAEERDLADAGGRLLPRAREVLELGVAARELLVEAGERRSGQRERSQDGVDGSQRREIRWGAWQHQLVDVLGAGQTPESVLAEVEQPELVGQGRPDLLRGELGQHDLATVGRRHQAARAVEHRPGVLAVRPGGSGVDAHPGAQRTGRTPRFGDQCGNRGGRGGHRVGGAVEARVHTVARGLHERPAIRLDRLLQDRVVAGERVAHRVGVRIPEARRLLEVGEEERDVLRGGRAHVGGSRRGLR